MPTNRSLLTLERVGCNSMPRYCHEDPATGRREYYSARECEEIAKARREGRASCPVDDVRLKDGRVLRFEVRFGYGNLSRKQNTPSPSGMVQVNLDSENTRVVYEEPDLPGPTAQGGHEQALSQAPAVGGATYFHVDPSNNQRVPFSEQDNAIIFAAQSAQASAAL